MIRGEFEISTDHTGLGDMVHGGIIATVFDEAMVWTLYRWRYQPHVTAKMTTRFRGVIEADTPLAVEARIAGDRGRRRMTEAVILTTDGDRVLANADGVYVPIPESGLDELTQEQRAEMEGLFRHFRDLDGTAEASR